MPEERVHSRLDSGFDHTVRKRRRPVIFNEKRLEKYSGPWQRVSNFCAHRPIQIVMLFVALFTAVIALSLAETNKNSISNNHSNITSVKSVLCSSVNKRMNNVIECHNLFDKLLAHPTRHEVVRLKEIVNGGQ